ncbi:hypothetical protein O7635_32935 [Asanoa sp. WMMD1127]|uniref:hypothetical protein n=1 Tax=Asanoa sp. WMMD1127 TaxID=3016107 RepID=UPI0024175410|nr:hypothetical protein [Asanoa sp. WMMD1127]MDG4826680.1 hypothetical protein [Asanoa sp. WMMD1127]
MALERTGRSGAGATAAGPAPSASRSHTAIQCRTVAGATSHAVRTAVPSSRRGRVCRASIVANVLAGNTAPARSARFAIVR